MKNSDPQKSKRAIGVGLILVSMLIVLGYGTLGHPQSANALVALQPQTNIEQNLMHAARGHAQLVWDAKDQTLTVKITMSGLAPDSTVHPAHIHKGGCETSDNGVAFPLTDIKPGKQAGSGDSVTVLKQVTHGIPASGWFINVHNGPTLSPDIQKTPIACGNIVNLNTSTTTNQSVELDLGPTQAPNQAVNGVANLSLANKQFTVTLTLSGLAPNSTHQAHIHQGSCRAQGMVKYQLTAIVADKNGNGTSKTVIPNVATIPANSWYVNVHLAATPADLKTQTGFDPLVCGDI